MEAIMKFLTMLTSFLFSVSALAVTVSNQTVKVYRLSNNDFNNIKCESYKVSLYTECRLPIELEFGEKIIDVGFVHVGGLYHAGSHASSVTVRQELGSDSKHKILVIKFNGLTSGNSNGITDGSYEKFVLNSSSLLVTAVHE